MLPHTTSAVSAFPEDDVRSSHSVCVYNGRVGTTGLFLCLDAFLSPLLPAARCRRICCCDAPHARMHRRTLAAAHPAQRYMPAGQAAPAAGLVGRAFARYLFYQYCMVYSIRTGGRKGSLILSNSRAIVLHQGVKCRWAGGMIGWLIRAQ